MDRLVIPMEVVGGVSAFIILLIICAFGLIRSAPLKKDKDQL